MGGYNTGYVALGCQRHRPRWKRLRRMHS